jgi:predicted RNase H-like HicB family nuclease
VTQYRFSIRVEKHLEGYSAFCSELQGCYAQGDTYEAAMDAIRDAVRLHIEDRLAEGEEIP